MSATQERDPEPGARVRGLVRAAERASLATTLTGPDGPRPYVSLVLSAADHDASPLLLLSDLADHSRNLAADPRVALLYDGTLGWREPLAGPRASLLGRAERADAAPLKARFVARHPGAAVYADFADFHLYRVAVERAHLVAGFGDIHWIEGAEVRFETAGAAPLAAAEADILAHMNADHGVALRLIARHLLDQPEGDWTLAGLDPEGADLRGGDRLVRIAFARPVSDPAGARAELVRLTRRARRMEAAAEDGARGRESAPPA
jgi:putative heme iron utilization protein